MLGLAFNHDESLLFSASADNTIIVWDIINHQLMFNLNQNGKDIKCLLFKPETNQLISCSDDSNIQFWNLNDRSLEFSLCGHKGKVKWLT